MNVRNKSYFYVLYSNFKIKKIINKLIPENIVNWLLEREELLSISE